MVIIHQLEVWDSSPLPTVRSLQENPKASEKNKPQWYPQQPERFIFTNLSAACWEAKRWKHFSWVSVS